MNVNDFSQSIIFPNNNLQDIDFDKFQDKQVSKDHDVIDKCLSKHF